MTKLKFSDGEEFDLSGSLWKEHRIDGWYVLGENKLILVKDEQEADVYISIHGQDSSLAFCKNNLHTYPLA
jgi:hypothetical protein